MVRRLLACALVMLLLPAPAAAAREREGRLPGARVTRDPFGIAHVSARTERDLFFLQGWVHAADRLFQMDVRRRQASGTLAELLGPSALPSDVQLRTIGLRRAAERSLGAVSKRARGALEAYAEGVNAWVASHPLPPEYAALHLTRFQPWTPVDSLAVGKLIAFGLSFDLDLELTLTLLAYQEAGKAGGFDGTKLFFEDLWRSQPFDPAATVPDASRAAPRPHRGSAAAVRAASAALADPGRAQAIRRLARGYLERARQVPLLRQVLERDRGGLGSNEWAVAGRHTRSGRPLLANDPHLGLEAPSVFYPIHLRGGGIDVIGSGFAGIPGVVLGHNRFISWGATTNPMDVTDTYLEAVRPDPRSPSGLSILHQGRLEPVLAIPEAFRQNNLSGRPDDVTVVPPGGAVPAATLVVPRRNHGPIIQLDLATGTALSVQYTGFSATREVDAFLIWNQARNLGDFRRGLEFFDAGSQNWAYSDVYGNIAYFTSGELPLREDLEAGRVDGLPPFFVRDGTGGNEWLPPGSPQPGQAVPYEVLPAGELPHTVNPPAGFFVNANNDPAGTTLDNDPLNQRRPGGGIYYLNPGYDGIRAGRITQLLRAELARGRRLSPADMARIQADVGLLDAQVFVPYLTRALQRARRSGEPALAALARDPAVREAVGRLARWDFTTPTGIREGYDASDASGHRLPPTRREVQASVAATIYSTWRGQVIRQVIDSRLGPLPPPDGQRALTALRHLLETFPERGGVGASGIDFFAVPGVADPADRRDLLLLRSLKAALDALASPAFAAAFGGSRDQDSYRWGTLHRVTFDHPLGEPFSVPPAGGAVPHPLPGLPGIPTDGGFGTVDASGHDARAAGAGGFTFGGGPAHRFVSQPHGAAMRAQTSIPGGTSGVVGERRYTNLLPLWLTNDAIPLLPAPV